MSSTNRNIVLIGGESGTGKSTSLRNIPDPKGVIALNCDSKDLPFPAKFRQLTVTDVHQVPIVIDKAEEKDSIHTIVIDTISYLMAMVELQVVQTCDDGYEGWKLYGNYWRNLMHKHVAQSSKNIIMLAHTRDILDEGEHVMKTMVKFKGSVMDTGVESYFGNVLASKKVALNKLEPYATKENKLLTITPQEENLGFKYVFQTQLTKETVHERMRGPIGLWSVDETFIDNDVQLVLDRLHTYYA